MLIKKYISITLVLLSVVLLSSFTGMRNSLKHFLGSGDNWIQRVNPENNTWATVTYGNGLFVALSIDGTGNRAMTSPDGLTWTLRNTPADNSWYSITYGNGLFVAVAGSGTGNRVMTSKDGINWTIRASAADIAWYSIAYGNGLYVAVGLDGTNRIMTSK